MSKKDESDPTGYERFRRRDISRILENGQKNRLTFFYFSDRIYSKLPIKKIYYILYN